MPPRLGFWGRAISATIRRLPSGTGGALQSVDDAGVVLQAIRRSDVDLPNIPRVRQPSRSGQSQALEVYHGPMQGSVRDPSREFPLMNRNQLVQHRNPAEHIEMINLRQSPQRLRKPGRNLKKEGEEDGFWDPVSQEVQETT